MAEVDRLIDLLSEMSDSIRTLTSAG
jgi:hypothetical protein